MKTYEKYLPKASLNERSKHTSAADSAIDTMDMLLADFEIAKDKGNIRDLDWPTGADHKKMTNLFNKLSISFETFKKDLSIYARLADTKIK